MPIERSKFNLFQWFLWICFLPNPYSEKKMSEWNIAKRRFEISYFFFCVLSLFRYSTILLCFARRFFFRQMNNKKWKKARVNETRKKVERSKKVEWYLVSERTKFPRRIDRKIKKRVQPAAENASLWLWVECSSLKLKSLMCFFWLDVLLLLVLQRAVFGSEEWTFGGKSWTAQVEVGRISISHKFSRDFHLGLDISLLHSPKNI